MRQRKRRSRRVEEAFVDRTTAAVEDELAALGYGVGTEITYVATAENVAANRTITTTIAVLGFLIVPMSLVGLANALRRPCLSEREKSACCAASACGRARARDGSSPPREWRWLCSAGPWAFRSGYALNRALVWMAQEVVNVEFGVRFQ